MKKSIIIVAVLALLGLLIFFFLQNRDVEKNEEVDVEVKNESTENLPTEEFIKCLVDSDLRIYGSATCPYCQDLIEELGGKDMIKDLYTDCSEEWETCEKNMKTSYVPEIQIGGELLEGERTYENFAKATDCKF